MTDSLLFLAGVLVLLGVGVLIGSGLHTRSIDYQYRRLAQRVRHLNARERALDVRDCPAAVCGSCPLEIQGTLLVRERDHHRVDED